MYGDMYDGMYDDMHGDMYNDMYNARSILRGRRAETPVRERCRATTPVQFFLSQLNHSRENW